MATLTIAAAARLCGCPRSTLQRAIRAGRLHLDADHRLDTDELSHAGYLTATAAPQTHAAGAQQPRATLDTVQRTMERLIEAIEELSRALRQMQQERSRSVALDAAAAQQPRSMERQRQPPRQPPAARARPPSDVDAAYQRMRVLQDQGRTLSQIAQQLTAEGFRTKQGRPWHKSTVSYVLRTHGR